MSVEAVAWAFKQDIKQSSAKLVLLALGDFANDEYIAYPSIATLQEKTSCSRQTIINSIELLIDIELISKVDKEHIAKKYQKNQNCYLLHTNKTSPKNRPVQKLDQSKNLTKGSLKIRPKVVQKLDPNHHITINKPSYKEKYKKEKSIQERIEAWKEQARIEIQPSNEQMIFLLLSANIGQVIILATRSF